MQLHIMMQLEYVIDNHSCTSVQTPLHKYLYYDYNKCLTSIFMILHGLITFVLACKIIAKIKIIIDTRCNVKH